MNRIETIARGLVQPLNPHASSFLGLLTLMWGLWIVNPLWSVFGTSEIYSRALEFAPEWMWGSWSTGCGLFILYSLYRNNAYLLSRSAGFAVWHWFTVAGMLWWGDWQNTAGLTYTFIGLYSAFVFLNIRVNYVKQGIKHF